MAARLVLPNDYFDWLADVPSAVHWNSNSDSAVLGAMARVAVAVATSVHFR